ncbi:isochorismatase family protein [Solilutibacter silvestris]|uniref:isochorismatase family protein n=1 Tax=Solilutibacter silvestris TaxID=1645665 RepID=UPI003D345F94
MNTALLVIDIQNDYFPGGAYPLWNTADTLDATVTAIGRAQARGELVVLVQHVALSPESPLFKAGTPGADIHPRILAAAPKAPVVIKHYADSFHETTLASILDAHGMEHLHLAGMMTQNCVTHTALSRAADRYHIDVLADCTTTVDAAIHGFALNALSTRVEFLNGAEAA